MWKRLMLGKTEGKRRRGWEKKVIQGNSYVDNGTNANKEVNPEYYLEGLMLKLQYFGHLMGRANSGKKNPDAGKD